MSKCKLIIFSDIHYLDKRPEELDFNLTRKLTQYSVKIIEKLIDKINEEIPDVSICLGDLIEDTFNHDKDIINYTYIWNKLKNIQTPFYSVIGNHDLRTMSSRKELEKIMDYKNATFSFDLNGYHLIILTTDIREDLGGNDGGRYKAQCMSEKEIKEIIKSDNNVIAIFNGHQHWNKQLIEDGKNYYVVGSLTDNIDMLGVPEGIYLEVELEDREIRIQEKHIEI